MPDVQIDTAFAAMDRTLWDVFSVFELFLGRPPRSLSEAVEVSRLARVDIALQLIGSVEFRDVVIASEAGNGRPSRRPDHAVDAKSSTELMAWAGLMLPILPETETRGARARTWRRRLAIVLADPLLRKIADKLDTAFVSDTEISELTSVPLAVGHERTEELGDGHNVNGSDDASAASNSSAKAWTLSRLQPNDHLSAEPREARSHFEAWRARNDDPHFHFSLPAEMPTSGVFRLEIEVVAPTTLMSSLYVDTGHGFNEEERIYLPPAVDGLIVASIATSREISQLRFDPTDAPGRFWLGYVRLQLIEAALADAALVLPFGIGHATIPPSETAPSEGLGRSRKQQIRLALAPRRDLTELPEKRQGWSAWRSHGQDPVFDVVTPVTAFITGWVIINIEFEGPPGATPSLYVDDGQGYSEDSRIHFPLPDNNATSVLTFLPRKLRMLRFDPLDTPGDFALGDIQIKSLSRFDAYLRISADISQKDGIGSAKLAALTQLVTSGAWDEAEDLMKVEAITSKPAGNYGAWLKRHGAPSPEDIRAMKDVAASLKIKPVLSIVMPTYNSDLRWLQKAIQSVRDQIYPNWELCIADDASTIPGVATLLKSAAADDPRIRVVFREVNGHIARATNSALDLASGDYIVFMDHDDEISVDALYHFAVRIAEKPDIDFIYSDEDKISIHGVRSDPFFKPDWSPEYLESCMYTAHLAAYRKTIVDKIGGLRPEFNGAQDYDFTLRFTEHVKQVAHIPRVLYHWRMISGSTAQSMDNKDYVIDAATRALQGRIDRTGRKGSVSANKFKGCFDLRREVEGEPLVSIVIPSAGRNAKLRDRSIDLLANCITSITKKSSYKNIEIIVVHNGDLRKQTLKAISSTPVRFVAFNDPVFNIATKMNLGAADASGEFLLFLNDDIEVITPDWLERMVSVAQNPGVGVVGAKLRYESGDLQHVGIAFCEGLPDHVRRLYPGDDAGYFYSSIAQRNYLAVTGACMLIRRDLFHDVGGFDERLAINYNDIDICLAVYNRGLRIVFCPRAELYHYESLSRERIVADDEINWFLEKWQSLLEYDPFYSPHFDARPPNFELSIR